MHTKIYRHLPVIGPGETTLGILKIRDLLLPISGLRAPAPPADTAATSTDEPGDVAWWSAIRDVAEEAPLDDRRTSVEARFKQATREAELAALEASCDPTLLPAGVSDVEVRELLSAKRAKGAAATLKARSKQHTVDETSSAASAAAQMLENRLTFVIAVDTQKDGEQHVSGIVSERHVLHALARHDASPDSRHALAGNVMDALANETVAELMTPLTHMITVRPEHKAVRCLALMLRHNIRHLPVVSSPTTCSARPKLEGILSIRDVLAPLTKAEAKYSPWGLPFYMNIGAGVD